MKNSTSVKKILILVTILAVPGFLYYLLQEKGKNRYKPLPIFGPKVPADTYRSVMGKQVRDTNYHIIENFKLVNQNRDTVTFDDYKGKVLIVNLFYTEGNTHAVTFANKAAKAFEATYANNKAVNFLSVSIDPRRDQPAVLARYAIDLGAQAGKWDLLTGDSTQVFDFLNKGLFIDAHQQKINGELKFTYSNMFILLDSKHRIRGYYEATNQAALSQLDDEIKVLLAEELRNIKDGR